LDLSEATTGSATLSAALAGLSSLQQLHLTGIRLADANRGDALTALVQLRQLTSLQLSGSWFTQSDDGQASLNLLQQPVSGKLQQLLAQPLPIQKLQLGLKCRLPVLDMAQLPQLTELDCSSCVLNEESVLPAQLQRLAFQSWGGINSLSPVTRLELKQLQHLSMRVDFTEQQPLLQLEQLPALQHLELQYRHAAAAAAATAPAWGLLPQLLSLVFVHYDPVRDASDPPTAQQLTTILEGIAAATNHTRLVLEIRTTAAAEDEPEPQQLAVCQRLTGLTRLKDLTILGPTSGESNWAAGDVTSRLALTALTSLTKLRIVDATHRVGSAAATTLARELLQLQHLDLSRCGLQLDSAEGLACLEAIGRLTQLTCLGLQNNPEITQQGLMQLTGLSRLQELHVQASLEVLEAFWAELRGQ
jgi:hypothetical protein